jgi:hypothetical protein
MGIIVGNGYSYLRCDSARCDVESEHVRGENDGQRDVVRTMQKRGWQRTLYAYL